MPEEIWVDDDARVSEFWMHESTKYTRNKGHVIIPIEELEEMRLQVPSSDKEGLFANAYARGNNDRIDTLLERYGDE